MAQEEKVLLLKDLSARLPYGVKVTYNISGSNYKEISTICGWELRYDDLISFKLKNGLVVGCNIKPYLRPLSSITEEERKELSIILNYEFYVDDDFALVAEDDRHRIRIELCDGYIDWLNAHHFDYRGLIPMGLALEAQEGMYKTD